MFRKEFKFPTILGILGIVILSVSIFLTVFFSKNIRGFLGLASQEAIPTEIKITNLTSSSFSVSYLTDIAESGGVSFGENESLSNLGTDDRDQVSGTTGQYLTHHITLRYLKPATKYFFAILSGGKKYDNKGQLYTVATTNESGGQSSQIYGTVVKDDGTPALGAIVYLNLNSQNPYSTLVKSSGNWLVTMANPPAGQVEIFVQAADMGMAMATASKDNLTPVGQITLGQTGTASPLSKNTTIPSSGSGGFKAPPSDFKPQLLAPASGSGIPSDKPNFSGTGIPGSTVQIEVHSTSTVSATITVDQNGNWNWTPPTGLTPGDHTVTVKTADKNGNILSFVRNFTVFASGTQVNQPATPSASPTINPSPTPTSTPIPTPFIQPTQTATISTMPASGNLTPTIFVTLLGLIFLGLGFGKIISYSENSDK